MNPRASIYSWIADPITAEAPCGPDIDAEPEVMNFMSVAEAQLPDSYRGFDKKAFEAKPTLAKLNELLAKSRDLRILVLASKFYILSDNLSGFVDAVIAMRDEQRELLREIAERTVLGGKPGEQLTPQQRYERALAEVAAASTRC